MLQEARTLAAESGSEDITFAAADSRGAPVRHGGVPTG